MNNFFSKYQCGFREGFNAELFLATMIGNWCSSFSKSDYAAAPLTDLLKAPDYTDHEILIAKLNAQSFDSSYLNFLYSFLKDRKHNFLEGLFFIFPPFPKCTIPRA